MVRAGKDRDQTALAELIKVYESPLRLFLTTRMRFSSDQANDVLQDFLTRSMIEGQLLARADAEKGLFRRFLIQSLRNHASNLIRDASTQKRSPPIPVLSLARMDPASSDEDPSHAADRAWARQVIGQALRRMRRECEATGRPQQWVIFRWRILGPILCQRDPPSYSQIVEKLGYKNPVAVGNALVNAKRMYARMLRTVIAQYADTDDQIDEEIRDLRRLLSN